MENIFELRFSFEQKIKDKVIYKFSNKQGGDFNVFSFHWQCFVWAAIIGFLRDERRPLLPPIADKPFSLNTMLNNGGEKDAQALICLAIAKAGSIDIMKNPIDAINLINEYANGGFYHIMKLIDNGENSFNDLEKVKQEIFSRNYEDNGLLQPVPKIEEYVVPEEEDAKKVEDEIKNYDEKKEYIEDFDLENEEVDEETLLAEAKKPWKDIDIDRLNAFFEHGMELPSIADRLGKSLYAVQYQLSLLGKIKMPLNVKVENSERGAIIVNKSGQVIYTDEAPLKVFNDKIYRFNLKSMCMTVKDVKRVEGKWVKGDKMLVAYSDSELYPNLSNSNFIDDIEDFVEGDEREENKVKVKGVWYDYYGDVLGSRRR